MLVSPEMPHHRPAGHLRLLDVEEVGGTLHDLQTGAGDGIG
jgi:hypothetical protein